MGTFELGTTAFGLKTSLTKATATVKNGLQSLRVRGSATTRNLSRFASYDGYVPDFSADALSKSQRAAARAGIIDVLRSGDAGRFANQLAEDIASGSVRLDFDDLQHFGGISPNGIRINANLIHGATDWQRAASVAVHEGQHFADFKAKVLGVGRNAHRRGEFRAYARQLDFDLRLGIKTPTSTAYLEGGYSGVGERIVRLYDF